MNMHTRPQRELAIPHAARTATGARVDLLVVSQMVEPGAKVTVLRITERAQAKNPNAGLSSEPFLGGAARVEVPGYPGRPPFFVVARTPVIAKYPCSTCHTMPLERMRGAAGSPRRAHWDVRLHHAPATVMATNETPATGKAN